MRRHTARHAFGSWSAMVSRCTWSCDPSFHNYGARGIAVCPEWRGRSGYAAFIAHMGPKPSPQHTVDRIDNDGNYEPGNVRWATRAEQNRNKKTNRFIEWRGDRRCLNEWVRVTGISWATLRRRVDLGWSAEAALTTPPMVRGLRRKAA